jgi:hypothetical protein
LKLPDGYIFKDENGNVINAQKIVLEKVNTLKIQSDNMETETHRGYYTTEEETTNKSKKVAWFTFWDNDFADKVELDLSNRELIQEDGKWFVVKKKKEYPKTLEKLEDMEDKGNISDGYHTFNELYEYRLLYNASMFNELAKQGLYDVHKSKKHSDGTIPFGDENWFIVQAELPTGQISNHYEMKDWELFHVPEKEKANHYDGHTPQDVAKRLRDFLTLEKLVEPRFKVGDRIKYKNGKNIDGVEQGIILSITDDTYDVAVTNDMGIFIPVTDQDNWELVPNKFDITTLKPFDKVLVRDCNEDKWNIDFFGYYRGDGTYQCMTFTKYQCIPYEVNKELLGTTNNPKEYGSE